MESNTTYSISIPGSARAGSVVRKGHHLGLTWVTGRAVTTSAKVALQMQEAGAVVRDAATLTLMRHDDLYKSALADQS